MWRDCGYDNTYGTKHYYQWCKEPVTTLKELADWIENVKASFEEKIRNKLESIREALRRLIHGMDQ